MKKILCFALCLVLLFTTGMVGWAEETPCEITFENSLYVLAQTKEETLYSPEDFLGVDCRKVYMLSKECVGESGYYYVLILVLNQSGKQARTTAMEQLDKFPYVADFSENIFAEFQLTLDLQPFVIKKR